MIKDNDKGSISVTYNNQTIKIDVGKELSISTTQLNSELKQLPSNYAYLCLVRDSYIFKRDKLEKEKNQAYAEAWIYYKESSNPPLVNDMVDKKAMVNKKYIEANDKYIKIVFKTNQLISLCEAYRSREKILQTLSANLRKNN